MRKLLAEFFGTYWLVFGGCGSALFAAGIPDLGIGFATEMTELGKFNFFQLAFFYGI